MNLLKNNPFSACIVLVTCPSREQAEELAKAMIEGSFAACVNIIGCQDPVVSFYRWDGVIQQDSEVLLLVKTEEKKLGVLYDCITAHHPYECPEFLVLPVLGGSKGYLSWMNDAVSS